jgi:hypothetical protein
MAGIERLVQLECGELRARRAGLEVVGDGGGRGKKGTRDGGRMQESGCGGACAAVVGAG